MTQTSARARLNERMNSRRLDLRLTWAQVAERAGVNRQTIHDVRFGTREIRQLTKRGIEDALSWTPGSIDRILAGGEPGLMERPADRAAAAEPPTREAAISRLMEIYSDPEDRRTLEDVLELLEMRRRRRGAG